MSNWSPRADEVEAAVAQAAAEFITTSGITPAKAFKTVLK